MFSSLYTIERIFTWYYTGNLVFPLDSLDSGLSAHFEIPVVLSDVGGQLVKLLRGDTPVGYPHLLDVATPG